MQMEGVAQALGKDRMFQMFNEVFRMSGAHDLKLETDEYDDSAEQQKTIEDEQFFQQMKEQFPQVVQTLQKLSEVVQGMSGMQQQMATAPTPQQPEQKAKDSPDIQPQLWAKRIILK